MERCVGEVLVNGQPWASEAPLLRQLSALKRAVSVGAEKHEKRGEIGLG